MTRWSKLSADEVERRRLASVNAMKDIERKKFAVWYQERCDHKYWTFGQCCAGCDHWESDGGMIGRCTAAQIVSGVDVLKSMGIVSSSYIPPPGHPYTEANHSCGLFRDNFDWSTLDEVYLTRIGALRDGVMREKPKHRSPRPCSAP